MAAGEDGLPSPAVGLVVLWPHRALATPDDLSSLELRQSTPLPLHSLQLVRGNRSRYDRLFWNRRVFQIIDR